MCSNHWTWQCDRVISSETAAGQRVLEQVVDKLQQCQWPRHDVFSVQLAVEEALVNAVKHGNRFAPDKRVHVHCRMSPELLQIEITDEGAGFDPATLPDPTDEDHILVPSGRGVMLMRSFMSRVEYNRSGNSVLMEKQRSRPE